MIIYRVESEDAAAIQWGRRLIALSQRTFYSQYLAPAAAISRYRRLVALLNKSWRYGFESTNYEEVVESKIL